jgi:hypothetical protein
VGDKFSIHENGGPVCVTVRWHLMEELEERHVAFWRLGSRIIQDFVGNAWFSCCILKQLRMFKIEE